MSATAMFRQLTSKLSGVYVHGAPNEEMDAHSRVRRRYVDGVRALQQIVATCEGEQLSGSLCGKVGAVQGHRPICWNHSSFQHLAGADECSGMDFGGSCCPLDRSLASTIRSMSEMAMFQQPILCGRLA
jgi:hypothetical protein